MKEKKASINKFIGVYDNYILPEECDKVIKLFENQNKFKNTLNRINFENAPILIKQDQQYFAGNNNIDVWWEDLKPLVYNFDIAWNHYIKNTGADTAYDNSFFFTDMKIQKTLPTEGYHVWHIEHGNFQSHDAFRAFVFSIYLNDVKKGGETEFLHQSVRVQPKTGRIVIWPAGFPYLHRGNPPLAGEKYILTSWMMLR
jgi:hypothetical protein